MTRSRYIPVRLWRTGRCGAVTNPPLFRSVCRRLLIDVLACSCSKRAQWSGDAQISVLVRGKDSAVVTPNWIGPVGSRLG